TGWYQRPTQVPYSSGPYLGSTAGTRDETFRSNSPYLPVHIDRHASPAASVPRGQLVDRPEAAGSECLTLGNGITTRTEREWSRLLARGFPQAPVTTAPAGLRRSVLAL